MTKRKVDNKENRLINLYLSPKNILNIYPHCNLGGPYPTTQKGNQFYLGIRNNAIEACYVEPMRTQG